MAGSDESEVLWSFSRQCASATFNELHRILFFPRNGQYPVASVASHSDLADLAYESKSSAFSRSLGVL